MPLFVRILSRILGHKQKLEGPYSLGKYGLTLNMIGFLFLMYATITFNFPSLYPVTSENMNYTSAAIGVIMCISLITWITTGRRHYTGPENGVALEVNVINETSGGQDPEKL